MSVSGQLVVPDKVDGFKDADLNKNMARQAQMINYGKVGKSKQLQPRVLGNISVQKSPK